METIERLSGDVLDINKEFATYGAYKAAVDEELQKSAESFVRIGYLLKLARDTDILTESGYGSVNEFAEEEYNLDKSQVSRFIRINDEFSEGGYSDRLQERYRQFGHAKLAVMLLLPAAVNEELSASYTKAEINTIREEIAEETAKTDLEVMMEEKDEGQQGFGIFGKAVYEICRSDQEKYLSLYLAVADRTDEGHIDAIRDDLVDILAPAGEAIITFRIAGEGKKMLSIKGRDMDPVLIDVRSGEKCSCAWERFINEIEPLFANGGSGREAWGSIYGIPFPEKKTEVAPVQPQKEKRSGRAGRVIRAEKPKDTIAEPGSQQEEKAGDDMEEKESISGEDREDPAEDNGNGTEAESRDDETGTGGGAGAGSAESGEACADVDNEGQLEGQMDITQFPEHMPEAYKKEEASDAGPAASEDDRDNGGMITDRDGFEQHIRDQKEIIRAELDIMEQRCEERDWDGLVKKAGDVIMRAESLKRMEDIFRDE